MSSRTILWLNKSDTALLKELAPVHGSKAEALRVGLRALAERHLNHEKYCEMLARWDKRSGYTPSQEELDARAKPLGLDL